LTELYNTEGFKALDRRAREHQRNLDRRKQRRLFRANYARYAAEAKLKNIQRAAEKLIAERLAAQNVAAQADDTNVSTAARKQPTAIDKVSLEMAQQQREVTSIA
jgi:hypothetical protein